MVTYEHGVGNVNGLRRECDDPLDAGCYQGARTYPHFRPGSSLKEIAARAPARPPRPPWKKR
jgi:hypothetical protein